MFKIKTASLLLLCLTSLAACGGNTSNQFFKNADVTITSQNGDSFVNLSSQFDLGPNVSLAGLDVTVLDPKLQLPRGTVSFSQLSGGIGQITVSVNVSLISNANPTLGETLPNRKPIPLALGAKPGEVLGVPISEHSRIYVGGDVQKTAFIGTALAIPGLDQVMSQLQTPANIFFMGNFTPKVMGVGGIYGSNISYQNGIAIFGKYTNSAALGMMKVKTSTQVTPVTDFDIDKIDRNTMNNLMDLFYGDEKTELHFE